MISIDRVGGQAQNKSSDLVCLDVDVPNLSRRANGQDVPPNGTLCIVMDTASGLFYDSENDEWIPV